MFEIYTGLALGLAGSLHCIGMCGPIALTLPTGRGSWFTRIFGGLMYNLGRTLTYGIMGALFGLIGIGFTMGGFQLYLSIAMGVVMILTVLVPLVFGSSFNSSKLGGRFFGIFKGLFGKLLRSGSTSALFIIGLLNGLLPCGLVYVAIAAAVGTGSSYNSAIFMIAFGLGTIPLMLSVSLAGNFMGLAMKKKLNRIVPYVVVIMGLLFILRGLDLGIPFLSPNASKLKVNTEQTHSKKHSCCTNKE